MTHAWHYEAPAWKLYTEDFELAKYLRRLKEAVNAGTYWSKKRKTHGWDFILPNKGLANQILRKPPTV